MSDRAAAALYNTALICQGIITPNNKEEVVDSSKIKRGREYYRNEMIKEKTIKVAEVDCLKCLGVDGKRDRKSRKIVLENINGNIVKK